MKVYKLWARVGCTVKVTEEDAAAIAKDPEGFMARALLTGQATVDGDTYFPAEGDDNAEFEKETNVRITS